MKIMLINPPQIFSKTQVAAGVIPPLGLLYIASFLKEKKHKVYFLDSVCEAPNKITEINKDISIRGLTFEEIANRIEADIDVVGISNLFSFAFPVVVDLIRIIRQKRPHIKIVLGGAHPSALPGLCLEQSEADFVVIGEGEISIAKLLDYFEKKEKIKNVDGIAYKKREQIFINPKKEYIKNLDSLPFPDREIVNWKKYYEINEAHGPTQKKWTPILSSRGCPFECTFCTSKLWNRNYRVRSSENVILEIEECVKKYGIKEFHFEDENMTLDNERVKEICRKIINRKLMIKWQTPNGIRASVTDNKTLDIMKKSGCYHITVAPESGSLRVLNDIIRKNQDLNKVTLVVRHASKIGLKTAAYFVIGLPGETVYDINLSIKYACELAKVGLDEVAFSNFIPLPGSELFEKLKNEGKLGEDWFSYTSIGDLSKSVSWSDQISNEQLQTLRKKAYLSFHL
jgi:magnesium-protoporphyrin IX monomethyl ester (oxidative) cyclase